MAEINPNRSIDPNTGYCSETKTYYSLRPNVPLPPPSEPLSITQYALSLLRSSTTTTSATTFLVDATTGESLSYGEFLRQVHSLARSLKTRFSLSKNDVAYILSLASLHVPVLYFSLLSLGVVISPANPLSSTSEVSHQIQLSKPSIAFATSHTSHKLPSNLRTILMDSPAFISLLNQNEDVADFANSNMTVYQSDPAAILYSSGTTGKVKGVLLSHLNVIAIIAGYYHVTEETDPNEGPPPHPVSFFTLPMFHVFGFFMLVRAASKGETLVFMERFDFKKMLKAVENYRVTYMPVSPPLIVAFINSKLTDKYDLSSLQLLGCGGAPLGKEVTLKFKEKFPNVEIRQGYGLTETGGAGSRVIGPDEAKRHGSVGRLAELMEAKIVDPATGEALPPGQKGELWLRGPTIMKGYVGDDKATSETVHSEGWLKTGDLCYFDSNGFLFIVDRLKELIKYKAYQVPPVELEHLLHSNPEIADAAVIPYPDEEAGQIPMAFVVAPYKKIRRVAFINSIPKSTAGKILRRELVTQQKSLCPRHLNFSPSPNSLCLSLPPPPPQRFSSTPHVRLLPPSNQTPSPSTSPSKIDVTFILAHNSASTFLPPTRGGHIKYLSPHSNLQALNRLRRVTTHTSRTHANSRRTCPQSPSTPSSSSLCYQLNAKMTTSASLILLLRSDSLLLRNYQKSQRRAVDSPERARFNCRVLLQFLQQNRSY
ncbi:hypothetical protein CUMW_131130 [Citrus unshiu]|uniref:4-coumarate--CoA ligase n=1 Tax=Citrus unshiu TaxID=55188 RepID=A0A2H5PF94_CITUN|nr:hypothetical protein CUMW_131130 [Citrus unshiu]